MASYPNGFLLPSRASNFSYGLLAAVLAVSAWLHLATLLVTILFALFALRKLAILGKRWLAVLLFFVLVISAGYGFGVFVHRAVKELPKIVADAVPKIVRYADNHNINLPFSDLDDLKEVAPKMVGDSVGYLGNFAKIATKEFVMLAAGIVIALGIFLNRKPEEPPSKNLYAHYHAAITDCFGAFYGSFKTVMGAQLLISLINTFATAVFVLATPLWPYAGLLIPLTFLCGLLPIVGNLLSNILIVGIAFGMVSPHMALGAMVFLVIIHKLEYLLNSKIIGSRIRHPMWLTLIALILGEGLMGIPGVILAPVILNFIKMESSRYAAPGTGTAATLENQPTIEAHHDPA